MKFFLKKILALIICLCLSFSLCACNNATISVAEDAMDNFQSGLEDIPPSIYSISEPTFIEGVIIGILKDELCSVYLPEYDVKTSIFVPSAVLDDISVGDTAWFLVKGDKTLPMWAGFDPDLETFNKYPSALLSPFY